MCPGKDPSCLLPLPSARNLLAAYECECVLVCAQVCVCVCLRLCVRGKHMLISNHNAALGAGCTLDI